MFRRNDQIAKRRTAVALMRTSGSTEAEIATQLKVSKTTVCRDLQHLREEWRQENLGAIDRQMVEDLERIRIALQSLWPLVLAGDTRSHLQAERWMRFRSELLGYGAMPDAGDMAAPIVIVEVVRPQMVDSKAVLVMPSPVH